MAKREQLDIIQRGVRAWNTWRQQHQETFIDLSHADLSGADLSRAHLREAVFIGANLSGVDLSGADLSEAYLIGATLSNAHLIGTTLSRADLSRADLSRADLRGSALNGANLSEAHLSGADLSETHLSDANLSRANLSRANLSRANLSRADLYGADLYGADLYGTDLYGADLSGAHLSRAILNEAHTFMTHFDDIDLRNAKGLEHIHHDGLSYISTSTLERSGGEVPESFLKGAGVGPNLIDYAHSLFGKPIEYFTCFLSYSSKDELFAQRLHNDLQQEGVRCWFAPEDMDVGDKIRHRIEESIKLYDKLLLILSEHSIASKWVAYEVERALNKEPQGISNVLYPVRVDQAIMTCDKAWAENIKSTRHIGDFEHWTDPQQYERNFKRLLRALNTKKEPKKA